MVALSLVSPNFLRYQGLLAGDDSVEMDVNLLFMVARNTIIPAVRMYSSDQWRVEAISKAIPSKEYNCKWWRKRCVIVKGKRDSKQMRWSRLGCLPASPQALLKCQIHKSNTVALIIRKFIRRDDA